jgi:hypothetical protein
MLKTMVSHLTCFVFLKIINEAPRRKQRGILLSLSAPHAQDFKNQTQLALQKANEEIEKIILRDN